MSKQFEYELQLSELKKKHIERYKTHFFDVQIECRLIILPAHRYILSSHSTVLGKQLASGVNKLNWAGFQDETCIALLRWIYTNEIPLGYSANTVTAEQWLDLLQASYNFQLLPLLETCETTLLSIVNRQNNVFKRIKASQLLEKCLELRLNAPNISPEDLVAEIDEKEEKREIDTFEELLQLNKLTLGYHEFGLFWDTVVISGNNSWQAHAHVLDSRSKNFLNKFSQETSEVQHRKFRRINFGYKFYGIERIFLRWLYTDSVAFDKDEAAIKLLKASRLYELRTLFERCEQAIVEKVDIISCAYFHKIAEKNNSTIILKRCNEVISKYFEKAKSSDCCQMSVDPESQLDNSTSEIMLSELPTETANDGLLTLNDDCLLHLFRFVSLVDLASVKSTCKRLYALTDDSFRLYKDKLLKITSHSMFADIWILKHFGKFIESLRLNSFYQRYASRDNILELISQFTGEQLKSISFHEFDNKEDDTFECLKTVLKNVECIKFRWFNYDSNIHLLLGYCENLKEVNIGGEFMTLNTDWCSKNPNVIKLTLSGLSDDRILEEVCKKLTRLECLSVDCIEEPTNKIMYLSQLSHLRKLRYDSSAGNVTPVLQKFGNKTVLEDLDLSYDEITETLANVFGNFPNLSKLAFDNCYGFDDNIQKILAKKLVNIQSLTFCYCEDITFKEITNIIENLLNLKKLSVTSCRNIKFIDSHNYLRLRKKRNLQIFLYWEEYHLSCESIGNNLSDYVQVRPIE